ncbi:hypothetical protein KPL35_11925 [Clostridium sp. CF011]|uniref:hypothetical protein n=1 Tax=unclassified Clostridium TaxID=2614128 RepID=UPI001C0CE061|nr:MULTISPECIES: hypothetical protein [unclassified Clostridium]MBU3092781.1 hypothetical protein [Clostridium sp. CF011]MBW9145760.1 hypothetical protein [Clostridium sp. CM027]UVE42175.1 hypothetical protein KTC92_06940 [Clostridium sp. CM027]WAG71200.1 hypothetical protein LL036_07240 [Clostridium sp. CF011]
MDTKCISTKRLIIINTVLILFSALFAIIVHALLPTSVDVAQFDSIFVKCFGFPTVAIFYFILLFIQCVMVVRYIGVRADAPKLQIGIRFGIAFAMIYLFGMQEIVVEGSLFSNWGLGFVKYQLIMGIGDGLPAILLCVAIAYFTLSESKKIKPISKLQMTKCIKTIAIIAITIFVERTIGYESGLISSDSATYPVPCYIWTGFFGILMGYVYVILYPLLVFEKRQCGIGVPLRFIATIGVNWMIFNSFIGLITKGAMPQMLLRSGLDVVVLFLASAVAGNYIIELNDAK